MRAEMLCRGVVFTLYAVRVAILVGLLVSGSFDPTYFTYITFGGVTALLTVGVVGLWVPRVMTFYARWVMPLLFQQTLLVALLIVLIVHLNGDIFASHAIPYGGTYSMSELHTGDWVVHQYPAIDMLLVLLATHHVVRHSVRTLWRELASSSSSSWARALYALYVVLGVMVPLAIYALVVPWQDKYPTPLNNVLGWLIIVALAALIGTLYLLFMLSVHDLHWPDALLPVASTTTTTTATPARSAALRRAMGAPVAHFTAHDVAQRRHAHAVDARLLRV